MSLLSLLDPSPAFDTVYRQILLGGLQFAFGIRDGVFD